MEKHLHIVCLDTPYPLDYGGIFDPFCKIQSLHLLGIKIHLHCFEYGRGKQPELDKYCVSVNYYQRNKGHKGFSIKLPYIVCSRSNKELPENLLKDDYPILLEGVHCTYLLNDSRFNERKIILRLHNVESIYYRQLNKSTASLLKKIYFFLESKILYRYEKSIANKALIVAMAEGDAAYYRNEFGAENTEYLPVFFPFQKVNASPGAGCYCLYHGNLSVPENERAVIWLLKNVFNDLSFPLVIAGKKPSARLERVVHNHQHTCLVASPSEQEMQDIIGKAQLHILPSFNRTGIKLKILNALFNGRHCVVNEQAVRNTGLESICHIGSSAGSFKKIISAMYHQPISAEEIGRREILLGNRYNNMRNAEKLIQWIW